MDLEADAKLVLLISASLLVYALTLRHQMYDVCSVFQR